MPRKIRQLIKDLEKAGFTFKPGKGDHRKFYRPDRSIRVVVDGKLGDDAKPYQEKQVQQALRKVRS
jgi:predicted RNA binding protein YcfA (HicA-like mRNA interferase family)